MVVTVDPKKAAHYKINAWPQKKCIDFKHPKYRNSTELSKYIWKLKDTNISPVIEWSIVTKVLSKTQLNFCKLYLSEKFYIIKLLNDPNLLNKKSELVKGGLLGRIAWQLLNVLKLISP